MALSDFLKLFSQIGHVKCGVLQSLETHFIEQRHFRFPGAGPIKEAMGFRSLTSQAGHICSFSLTIDSTIDWKYPPKVGRLGRSIVGIYVCL